MKIKISITISGGTAEVFFYGSEISRFLHVFLTRKSIISRCPGIEEIFSTPRFA